MNKLIRRKKKNNESKQKKVRLEMALAKLAMVRNTLSINQLLEHRGKKN